MNPIVELRDMKLSRPGESSAPVSRRFPEIRGGVCEHCGVIDRNYPGDQQYKLCQHYSRFRDVGVKCTFCKEGDDHDQTVRMSRMLVMEDPYLPGNLIMHCGKYECQRKFEKRFNIST